MNKKVKSSADFSRTNAPSQVVVQRRLWSSRIAFALMTAMVHFVTTFASAVPPQTSIELTAVVEKVWDDESILDDEVGEGDTLKGMVTFSSGVPLTGSSVSHSAYLFGGALEFFVQSDGLEFGSAMNLPEIRIEVLNDQPAGNGHRQDVLLIRSYRNHPLPNGATVDHISWQLEDGSGDLFQSSSLPSRSLNGSRWSVSRLLITGSAFEGGGEYLIVARVTAAKIGVRFQ
jgi:hypothetical protein